MVSQPRGEGEWEKRAREREKRGIGWIKGPCMREKKSSRRDGDRQGHTEQGGPDREGERECTCYYIIYLPSQLLHTSLLRDRFLSSSLSTFFFSLVFGVASAAGN